MENNEIILHKFNRIEKHFFGLKQFLMLKIYLITQGSRNPISINWFIPTLSIYKTFRKNSILNEK